MQFIYDHSLLKSQELDNIATQVLAAHRLLHERSGAGAEFTGWLDYTDHYDRAEYDRLKRIASQIRGEADLFVVVGIGGSYLGAKAAIDALSPYFGKVGPEIVFAGHQLSSEYLHNLLGYLEGKSVYLNVISKSGTTTEPAVAFRILKEYMESRYGKEGAQKRIIATTDRAKGALRSLATRCGYETFVIPDDVGGRYSVMTPVGLLPMAVAGIDTDAFLQGFSEGMKAYSVDDLHENPCYQYAAVRTLLHRRGKSIEVLVSYEPKLAFLAEWWMQLYGESDGKDGKGLFPTRMNNTSDLHSMGQMIQDGPRVMLETVLSICPDPIDLKIPRSEDDVDGLNYLAGKSVDFVNRSAMLGTVEAHVEGRVPNLRIELKEWNAKELGRLMYFFMKACGISGYLLGVNPFNQPGVEDYKRNMFRLLGKP